MEAAVPSGAPNLPEHPPHVLVLPGGRLRVDAAVDVGIVNGPYRPAASLQNQASDGARDRSALHGLFLEEIGDCDMACLGVLLGETYHPSRGIVLLYVCRASDCGCDHAHPLWVDHDPSRGSGSDLETKPSPLSRLSTPSPRTPIAGALMRSESAHRHAHLAPSCELSRLPFWQAPDPQCLSCELPCQ